MSEETEQEIFSQAYPVELEGFVEFAEEEEDDDYYCGEDDDDSYCFTCNNLGTIECECGGDLCVCMNNGEMPCPDCGSF